jgi:streptomycin 6-kinase
MLKLSIEEDECQGSVLMEWWDGDGAARVLARDDTALLMERALGSASLAGRLDPGATTKLAAYCALSQLDCMPGERRPRRS